MMVVGVIQLINLALVLFGVATMVLFFIVLLKLNKALDIWLRNNQES